MSHIAVIGAGYVGLPTALWLTELGHDVVVMDSARERVDMLRKLQPPFSCPELSLRLRMATSTGRLSFELSLDYYRRSADVEIIVLAVPADTYADGSIDLSVVVSVIKMLVEWQSARKALVCVRSTLSVGSSVQILAAVGDSDLSNRYIYWPAFLRQHRAFVDLSEPDRIILGACSKETMEMFVTSVLPSELHKRVLVMSLEEAEAAKQMSNCVLAVNQVLTAELAVMCEEHAIEPKVVIRGVAGDFRIGGELMEHHPGLGDLCLRKDLSAMCRIGGESSALLKAAANRSDDLRRLAIDNIVRHVSHLGDQSKVAIVGLGYAAGVGDVRGALSPQLIASLQGKAKIRVWDAYADVSCVIADLPGIETFPRLEDCLRGSDAAVLLVDHPELKEINWQAQVRSMKRHPSIFDFAYALSSSTLRFSEFIHAWYAAGTCQICADSKS